MMMPDGTRAFENTEMWKGAIAICWQFHLDKVEETREIINKFNQYCAFEKIDSEKSIEDDRKQARRLIDEGSYGWCLDPENGTLYEELSEKEQEELGWHGSGRKWSKWTVEKLLQKWGWEDDEVYWFSIGKGNGFCYQLILKDGDWICCCPAISNRYNVFINVGQDCKLPYSSDWEEREL